MRIGLNALSILNRSGTGFYTRALVDYLSHTAPAEAETHVWLPAGEDERLLFRPSESRFPEGVIPHHVPVGKTGTRAGRVLWERLFLSRDCRRFGIDVLHNPTGIAPPRLPCLSTVTIHDTAFLAHPKDFAWKHRFFLARSLPRSARSATMVFTDSEWSKAEIMRRLGVDREKIAVVPLGVDDRYFETPSEGDLERVRRNFSLPQDFALYVGTLEPRKNLGVLIESVELLRNRIEDFRLVIAGRRGWKTGDLFRRVRDLGLEERVLFTGFVPEGDLPALYHLSRVFVYPSKYEGFGLPPLEAMAAGRPVICSNGSSLPEVVGNAALLVNTGNAEELAHAIHSLWEDDKRRAALGQAARERAREFPWRTAAAKTFQLISQAAS